MGGIRRISFEAVGRRAEELFYLLIIAYLGVVLLVGVSQKAYAFAVYRIEVSRLKQEIATRTANVDTLNKNIREAQSPEYSERLAREDLGMARPGETQFKEANPANPHSASAGQKVAVSSPARPARFSVLVEAWNALKKLFGR